MKYWHLVVFIVVAAVQVAVPGSLVWKREHTLREGTVWKFRTAPVDPIDAFRGRYVALKFDAETQEISPPADTHYHQTVYVTLRQNADGYAEIDQVFGAKPAGNDFFKAQLNGKTIDLPF